MELYKKWLYLEPYGHCVCRTKLHLHWIHPTASWRGEGRPFSYSGRCFQRRRRPLLPTELYSIVLLPSARFQGKLCQLYHFCSINNRKLHPCSDSHEHKAKFKALTYDTLFSRVVPIENNEQTVRKSWRRAKTHMIRAFMLQSMIEPDFNPVIPGSRGNRHRLTFFLKLLGDKVVLG